MVKSPIAKSENITDTNPVITTHKDFISYEWFGKKGHHRENAPAYIETDLNGNVTLEIWGKNGKNHRVDGPAYIEYLDGTVEFEFFYINGKLYPALKMINDLGISENHNDWTDEQRQMFSFHFLSLVG